MGAADWLKYITDNPDYADDPDAVVDWFFKRTTFYDSEAFLLPVGIEEMSLPLNAISPPEYFEFSQKELKEMLPPQPEWTGESIKFAVDSDSMWATPAEVSDFNETATYAQVSQYASRLADAAPDKVKLISLYTYPNYEDLWMLIISESEDKSPEGLKASGKPTIFIDSGIHPGESSGVNAGLMLVRDMVITGTQKGLLEKVNLVYIPVLNVQGYIRQNPSGRINQHGPNTSGRRPNGHWYNINRDFGKLDSPEARAVVKVFTDYSPHFYIDAHSTNGMNYQYDVTWCGNGNAGLSPRIYDWLESEMTGDLSAFIAEQGHIPGPCIDANNPMSPEEGYYPYFSDGTAYSINNADHRQIPAYLLEIHSLKPNKQRVLGAYVFFVGVMDISGSKKDSLVTAIAADKTARLDPVPIAWDYDNPPPMVDFLGMEYSTTINEELGIEQMIWTDVSKTYNVEMSVRSTPFNPPKRPKAYYIPGVWSEVIDRLKMHGIPVETLTEEVTVDVIRYRVDDFSVGNSNREGRQTASGTPVPELHTMTYSPGDVRVDVDNPLGTLAVALLDPSGESSFFYWGFSNAKMVSHEYGSNYIVVPMAERMLSTSPEIAADWLKYITDNPDYADDPDAVVDWFFKRTTFYDSEAFLLPVGIEEMSLPLNAISPPEYFEFSQKELKEMLPPQPEWTGESMKFAVDSDSIWATPAEVSDFNETATYAQVSQYASRLADAAPDKVKLISLYTYPNYEDLWMLIISESEDKSPEGLKASGKPTIFIDSGIHPGESSGVNAGLMLVRDMVITGTQKT